MRKYLRAAAMMMGVLASGGSWASDDDARDGDDSGELPELVAARVREEFPRATVASVVRHGEWWEASVVSGLQRHDLILDPVGNVVEKRETIPVRALPDEARASLARAWPRHEVWRATRITAGDDVFHEVQLARGDRRATVLLDAEGKVLAGTSKA